MAVPKSKISKSRRNMRRSHHALDSSPVVEDKKTGELRRPHHICLKTGMYKGEQVIDKFSGTIKYWSNIISPCAFT